MQVTFDTSNAADVAFVRLLLGISTPTPAPAPGPASGVQQPPGSPNYIPAGASATFQWVSTPGGWSGLNTETGAQIALHWNGSQWAIS